MEKEQEQTNMHVKSLEKLALCTQAVNRDKTSENCATWIVVRHCFLSLEYIYVYICVCVSVSTVLGVLLSRRLSLLFPLRSSLQVCA